MKMIGNLHVVYVVLSLVAIKKEGLTMAAPGYTAS
jgi:hypothetical protein